MKISKLKYFLPVSLLLLCGISVAAASEPNWTTVGPDGGDARSFAADPSNPQHLYLGTATSWLYQSNDGGSSWKRLTRLGKKENLVLDSMVVDAANPKHVLIGAWELSSPGGGLFSSMDGGSTWSRVGDMDGQSIRALAQSRSDSRQFVAGTLKGIYRSQDGGEHWKLISPPGSTELHEVESIAIDPGDPNMIYAGTWHLPWKTTDGGANWHNIKQGVIDDSDVFSIIIDPKTPAVVYASACSGIYKSESAGELFHKAQGIPNTARRTRVLMQDPVNQQVVYAGTTEGLYRSSNGGSEWSRITDADVIVNDVFVDPSNAQKIMLATDRSGVMVSSDNGTTFKASNSGFTERQVTALLADAKNPQTLYAGVVNDKRYGGVFVSKDSGTTWQQHSEGLDGRDVFSLAQAADGTLLVGTSRGIFKSNGGAWSEISSIVNVSVTEVHTRVPGKKTAKGKRAAASVKTSTKTTRKAAGSLTQQVNAVDASGDSWYAATAAGLFVSRDQGATWEGPAFGKANVALVHVAGQTVLSYGVSGLQVSSDAGKNWQVTALPERVSGVQAIATTPEGDLWVGGREGLYWSTDQAKSWHRLDTFPVTDINSLDYNPDLQRLMVTARSSTLVFALDTHARDWKWWDAGWTVHQVHSIGGRLVGASLFDGVVVQPKVEEASATVAGAARSSN